MYNYDCGVCLVGVVRLPIINTQLFRAELKKAMTLSRAYGTELNSNITIAAQFSEAEITTAIAILDILRTAERNNLNTPAAVVALLEAQE